MEQETRYDGISWGIGVGSDPFGIILPNRE